MIYTSDYIKLYLRGLSAKRFYCQHKSKINMVTKIAFAYGRINED